MVSLNYLISSPKPPISLKEILPGSSFTMLYTIGSTSLGNILIIVNVVMSRETLHPTKSLFLSNLALTPTRYLGPLEALTMNFSSSNFFKTSPMIYPTLYKAFK
mmetsp:Transcript_36929/g.57253  ORF Transcript_36929/g.57253 Transcript_36929/m.57253 type:complete len:104 (-) Transcript_36929:27-338(-)